MPQTPNQSPRRVLANLTTNASFTPAKLRVAEGLFTDTPPKNQSPHQTSQQQDLLSPKMGLRVFHAGQKRSIDQVDGVEKQQETKQNISFHASQEPPVAREDEFHIEEEMSQTTMEPLPTLLQPVLAPLETHNSAQGDGGKDSQGSVSMSSLIDFDPAEEEVPSTLTAEAEARRVVVLEKAAILRSRLQLAMYKVQTEQIEIPFSKLKSPEASPSLPPLPLSRPTEGLDSAPTQTLAKEASNAPLNLLPAPKLVPTTYSARYMVDPNLPEPTLPSSPPLSTGVDHNGEDAERACSPTPTPTQTQPKTPSTPTQLSSPPETEGDEIRQSGPIGGKGMMSLTSSVVKGEAANGLLELMKGGL